MRTGLAYFLGLLTAIVGFAIFAITMGYQSIDVSDWMTFFGATFGAVITIAAAILTVEWQMSRGHEKASGALAELLEGAITAGKEAVRLLRSDPDARDANIYSLANIQAESLIAAREVAHGMRTNDANFARCWRALDLTDGDFTEALSFIEEGFPSGMVDQATDNIELLTELAEKALRRLGKRALKSQVVKETAQDDL